MTEICTSNRAHFGDDVVPIGALVDETRARLDGADPRRRTVFVVDSMRQAIGAIAFGIAEARDFGVIERTRLSPAVEARIAEHGVALVDAGDGRDLGGDTGGAAAGGHEPGRVTVLTSGTTGLLKLIPHSPRTLNTFDRVEGLHENTWFLPYQIGSYAWYQMVSLGLFKPGQHLVPGDFADLAASFEAALRRGIVTAISSTPTFWRHALMLIEPAVLAAAPMRNLSLGGEIVDQPILDRLAALYPQARIRHIYASSEAGAAIVVTDGRAGFDAALAERTDGAVGVRVEDGRLYIRSPYANTAIAAGWVDTGDLVERRGDRFLFCGRASGTMINVGGQKAFAPDIEAHLMRHPDVIWARVTARRAPLVGNLPVAEVVLVRPMAADEAEAMLTAHCANVLADYAVPRMWDFLEAVPLRASLKS